jgi:hypothetical protein
LNLFVERKIYLLILKTNKMNANVKGMLWTAGAIVVGILVAKLIQDKLMPSTTPTAE